jgi:hypothetical protein
MPVGECRLCKETRQLLNSHFIPAAFYRSAKNSDPSGEHPVVVTKNIVMQMSKQATAPLLCPGCEHRFNKLGEKWTLANSWQADGSFPLRTVVQSEPPSYSKPGFTIYDTAGVAGVDQERLVYFGASIFWRASTNEWHLVERGPRLDLGQYEEELRLFLLGKADFPANAALALSISAATDVPAAAMAIFPYYKNHNKDCRQYNFTMNGLTLDLFVGKSLPPAYRGMCLWRSAGRPVFFAASMDAQVVQEFGGMMSTAKTVGKLAK